MLNGRHGMLPSQEILDDCFALLHLRGRSPILSLISHRASKDAVEKIRREMQRRQRRIEMEQRNRYGNHTTPEIHSFSAIEVVTPAIKPAIIKGSASATEVPDVQESTEPVAPGDLGRVSSQGEVSTVRADLTVRSTLNQAGSSRLEQK